MTDETTKQLCDYILQTKHKIEELKEFNSNNYIPSYVIDELPLKTIDFKTETGKLIRLIDLCGEDFDENQRIFEEKIKNGKHLRLKNQNIILIGIRVLMIFLRNI